MEKIIKKKCKPSFRINGAEFLISGLLTFGGNIVNLTSQPHTLHLLPSPKTRYYPLQEHLTVQFEI